MASTVAAAASFALDGSSNSAQDARRALMALLQTGGSPDATQSGIRGDTANSGGLLVTAGSGLSVVVAAGQAFLTSTAADGVSIATFTQSTLTLATANASQDRYDWIIAHVTSANVAQLEVVTGTAGAGAAPDLVSLGYTKYVKLASVRVPAAATSLQASYIDTSMRVFTTGLGGLPPGQTTGPTWKSWTPSWTGNGSTAPTIANGTITGSYFQDSATGMCEFNIIVTFGTTTGQGNSDFYYLSLPIQPTTDAACAAYYDFGWHGLRGRVDATNQRVIVGIEGSFTNARPAAPAGAGIKLITSGRFRYQ